MSALRAFRKPEVSVSVNEDIDAITQQSYTTRNLKLYSGDEREPLPLALHHTPLTVSIGLFRDTSSSSSTSSGGGGGHASGGGASLEGLIFVSDPSHAEELAMDGLMSFSVNSHRYVCMY
jgi:exosome complex component RRP45